MLWLSDLHLGPGDDRDDFCADDALLDLLRRAHAEAEKVGLLGDTADLLQAGLGEIERAHPRVCQAIEDYVSVIVRGNHDDVDTLFGKETWPFIVSRGVYYCHGHREFDPFGRAPLRWIADAGTKAGALLELLIDRDVDWWIEDRTARLLGRGRHGDSLEYQRKAVEFARRRGCRLIVMGHTHQWAWAPPYANCGHWTGRDAARRRDCIRVED